MIDKQTKNVVANLEEILTLGRPLVEARKWCDGLGYLRRVRSDPGPRSSGHSDNGDTLCSCGDTPPDDGRLIPPCGLCRSRSAVSSADRLVEEARNNLVGALRFYEEALEQSDSGHAPRPQEYQVTGMRPVKARGLAEAREAKKRREARGEGHG